MKIRNGFVSNSSSSSFVVAFPTKPNDAADVWKFMFDAKDGGISVYDRDGLSHAQISSIVFEDIKGQSGLKEIADEFEKRYHYHPNSGNVFWTGKVSDEYDGAWYYPINRYFGSDKTIMDKIRDLSIEDDKRDKEYWKARNLLIEKSGIDVKNSHAYDGGKDYNTGNPYTKEQISKSEKIVKELSYFENNDPEFLALTKENWNARQDLYDQIRCQSRKISEKDAKNFMDDNEGKFIFIVEYSDNDGDAGCTLEHGDIFRNVPHVVINNH